MSLMKTTVLQNWMALDIITVWRHLCHYRNRMLLCVHTYESDKTSSLLNHMRTHVKAMWSDHFPHPHPRGLNTSVVQIIMGLLVNNTVTYFGKHYLLLRFLLHVPMWLLWNLPPMQPESRQVSHLPASETLCWLLRAHWTGPVGVKF